MTTLVLGASGATGHLLVQQLLAVNESVKVIVRSREALHTLLPLNVLEDKRLVITQADLLSLTDDELAIQLKGCRSVVSCLGHNLTFKGMFGQPRRLVKEAVQRLCHVINSTSIENTPIKFILMNTTGNRNLLADDKISFLEKITISLIRALFPAHADNEEAASYLQNTLPNQKTIEWVVVRPDSLIDNESVTAYDIYPSPIRSAIFDSGKTSRINVAHFMTQLVNKHELWLKWKSQMPVIYNQQI